MLIGLAGKAGVGKDTACQFIQDWGEADSRKTRREAFADRLKISAARALGHEGPPEQCIEFCNTLKQEGVWIMSGEEVEDYGFRYKTCVTGRSYLQLYGTEAHRKVFGDDFWIEAVLDTYSPEVDEIVVVTDCRFPNEAQAIRDYGGEVWNIVRPDQMIVEDGHASEQPLDPSLIDQVIVNDQSLDHLRDLVLSQLERLVFV